MSYILPVSGQCLLELVCFLQGLCYAQQYVQLASIAQFSAENVFKAVWLQNIPQHICIYLTVLLLFEIAQKYHL